MYFVTIDNEFAIMKSKFKQTQKKHNNKFMLFEPCSLRLCKCSQKLANMYILIKLYNNQATTISICIDIFCT